MKKNFNYFLFFLLSLCWHIVMAPFFIHYHHPNLSLLSFIYKQEKENLSQSSPLKKNVIPFVKYRKQFVTTSNLRPYSKTVVKSYSNPKITHQARFHSSKKFSKTNKMMTINKTKELGPKLTQNMLPSENKKLLKKELNIAPELNQNLKEILPKNSGLNIEIITPDGIKLDQMNNLELKFYTFNQRHIQSLLAAFYSSYNDFLRHYPHVNLSKIGREFLSAEVTFTNKGQIERIQFIKTSDIIPVQWFFQDILERNRLPNPPKELLINDKLQIIYSLSINDQ